MVTCYIGAWQTYRQTEYSTSLPLAGEVIISNYKRSKRVVRNYIFLILILKHINLPAYDHSELASLYTVSLAPLMVWVVWLSLRRANEQARPIRLENCRIGQSLSNRIESNRTADSSSNRISKLRRSLVFQHVFCSTVTLNFGLFTPKWPNLKHAVS